MVNLPDPPDDDDFLHGPDALVIWFLWDGKQSTGGRTAVCQSYDDGGLRSVDAFPFLSSAKTCWLNRLMSEGSVSGNTEFKLFPDLHKLKSLFNEFVNLYTIILMILFTKGLFTSKIVLMLALYLYST